MLKCLKSQCRPLVTDNEEGIKEVKKEGVRTTTVRLPALFVRSSTLCLTPDASGQSPSFFYFF